MRYLSKITTFQGIDKHQRCTKQGFFFSQHLKHDTSNRAQYLSKSTCNLLKMEKIETKGGTNVSMANQRQNMHQSYLLIRKTTSWFPIAEARNSSTWFDYWRTHSTERTTGSLTYTWKYHFVMMKQTLRSPFGQGAASYSP